MTIPQTCHILKELHAMPNAVQENVRRCLCSCEWTTFHILQQDVYHYLKATKLLPGLERIRLKCEDVLLQALSPDNVLYMIHVADDNDLFDLRTQTVAMICNHVPGLIQNPGWATLTANQIKDVFTSRIRLHPNLNFCKDALNAWLSTDCPTPSQIETYSEILDFLQSQMQNIVSCKKTRREETNKFCIQLSSHRGVRKSKLKIYVTDIGSGHTYEVQNSDNKMKAMNVSPGFAICCSQADVTEDPRMFITGGTGKNGKMTLECDIVKNKWKVRKDMSYEREFHSLCAVNDCIYAIGGYSENEFHRSLVKKIEKFDRKSNKWDTVAQLHVPVYRCVAIATNNIIFIIGGVDENEQETSLVQMFDVKRKRITEMFDLPFKACGGKAVELHGYIYFASSAGHFVRIDPKSKSMNVLQTQPRGTKLFNMYCKNNNEVIFSYGANPNVLHDKCDCTFSYDITKMSWNSVPCKTTPCATEGQCMVEYPSGLNQIPLCD